MEKKGCDIGLIGLGVMGRNFLLNVADQGFAVAGYDLDAEKTDALEKEKTADTDIRTATAVRDFVNLLRRPRAVMLLVPAGDPVDAVIGEIAPLLEPGDLIIDSGNSHFKDTDRRGKALAETKLEFMGMGISGGESGARHGPSLMPGGSMECLRAGETDIGSGRGPGGQLALCRAPGGRDLRGTMSKWSITASNTASCSSSLKLTT